MISKTELRVGNFVRIISLQDKCENITGIMNNGVQFSDKSILEYDKIEPIALTDEILIKAVFIYGRKYCLQDFYDLKEIQKDNNEIVWLFLRNNESLKYLKYVHEAQNIFYSLSGEELEINL